MPLDDLCYNDLKMPHTKLVVLSIILTLVQTKPTTESTHDILKRLGFDQINKPIVNSHSKRVAPLDTNKARHHNDVYNSDTDSHMFIVKLPPHSPYYAHTKPEKFENEVVTKPPMSFRTNGKPARVYHWNIPIIKKLSQPKHKTQYRKIHEDSKIYHLKILPNQGDSDLLKKYKKFNKHAFKDRSESKIKQSKYHKNHVKFYKFNDAMEKSDNHILSIKELAENGMEHLKMKEYEKEMQDDRPMVPSMEHKIKKHNSKDKYANEVLAKKHTPVYYSPALPKQNSFLKYFPGNGKPKSFYVIEKSEKPTRYHRLL